MSYCIAVRCALQLIDFYRFEETFRIDHQHHHLRPKNSSEADDAVDGGGGETPKTERRMSRRFETVSLLENNRMRNVGRCFRCSCFHQPMNMLPQK